MHRKRYLVIAIGTWLVMLVWLVLLGRVKLVGETDARPYDLEMLFLTIAMFPVTYLRALYEEFIFRFFPVFLILGTTYCVFVTDLMGTSWVELRPGASMKNLYVRLVVYGIPVAFVFAIAHRGSFIGVLSLQGVLGIIMYGAFLLAVGKNFCERSLVKSMLAISFAHALYNTTVDALAGARIMFPE